MIFANNVANNKKQNISKLILKNYTNHSQLKILNLLILADLCFTRFRVKYMMRLKAMVRVMQMTEKEPLSIFLRRIFIIFLQLSQRFIIFTDNDILIHSTSQNFGDHIRRKVHIQRKSWHDSIKWKVLLGCFTLSSLISGILSKSSSPIFRLSQITHLFDVQPKT